MSNIKENIVQKQAAALLRNKPVWVWWIFYVVVTGALFGIFSLALYLLAIQWWIGVLILLAAGIIWGSVKYGHIHGKIKVEEEKAAKLA